MVIKIAFLFPGQGSQFVGMGSPYLNKSEAAKALLLGADEILGFNISKIMFGGPEEKLKETDITQPALFISSAMALALLKDRGISPNFVAGHSLGEYSALYAAGTLGYEEALKLVRARGRAMQECAIENPGTMAAILGLDRNVVGEVCHIINKDVGVCVPANFNAAQQTVISGTQEAVLKAMELCEQKGASKAIELNVAGAFHSPLMKKAAEIMKPLIEGANFAKPRFPLITNVDGIPTTSPAELKAKLIAQIDHPVLWNDSLLEMLRQGVETFVEVGSGKILSSLVRRLDKNKTALWTDEFEAIEKRISTLSVQS